MIESFNIAALPHLHFGTGKISILPKVIKGFGDRVLLIKGANSLSSSSQGVALLEMLSTSDIQLEQFVVDREPSPDTIDAAVKKYQSFNPEVVLAVGGGSVLDAGKAISAMMPLQSSVKDYLEGVGTKSHPGKKTPFICIPTTSGTGSEATKNAVLSEVGKQGYKRSLRHDHFVPDVAIVDPSLTLSCSPLVTASSGMDAFTQLLESYLSTRANPFTDALALEGLKHISESMIAAYSDGSDINTRAGMSLAAYLSGVTLANAGLGLVHGFASAIGGYFNISHGIICSSLMIACNKVTVRKLRDTENGPALKKYATVGKLFTTAHNKSDDYYIDSLLALIESWTHEMKIPRLSEGNVSREHFDKIILASDNKFNPVALNKDEMKEVLEESL